MENGVGLNTYSVLKLGVEWIKTPNGKIFLLANPGASRRLLIDGIIPTNDSLEATRLYPNNAGNNYPLVLFKDNILQRESINFFNYDGFGIGQTFPLNSLLELGQIYPTYYHSPMFTKEMLSTMKRTKYIYALFDNKLGLPTFNQSDVNTTVGQVATDLVGRVKQRLNANISIKYEDSNYADTSYDNYGYEDLLWDGSAPNLYSPALKTKQSVLFKQALQGVGYSYQLIVWGYDEAAFTLAGYQILANVRGSKFIHFSK